MMSTSSETVPLTYVNAFFAESRIDGIGPSCNSPILALENDTDLQ
jgi:hypothetical protein